MRHALIIFLVAILLGVGLYAYHEEQIAGRPIPSGDLADRREGVRVSPESSDAAGAQEIKDVRTEEKVYKPGGVKKEGTRSWGELSLAGILAETNRERTLRGMPLLNMDSKLVRAAEKKVDDMFAHQYFAHVSPEGVDVSDIIKSVGYDYIAVAENLAMGGYESDAEVVAAWMGSPPHRRNILNERFTEIGIAAARGSYQGRTTWLAVQEFGMPRSECPAINYELAEEVEENKGELDAREAAIDERRAEIREMSRSDPQYEQKVDEFNELVAAYNALSKETKHLVDLYNSQVRAYNDCAVP